MPVNHSNTNCVITILIHSDKTRFQNVFVSLLRHRRCFHCKNAMILMPQICDVTANENARYKRNELELVIAASFVQMKENLLYLKDACYTFTSNDSGLGQQKLFNFVSFV